MDSNTNEISEHEYARFEDWPTRRLADSAQGLVYFKALTMSSSYLPATTDSIAHALEAISILYRILETHLLLLKLYG
ncbi:hypothetical protein L3X38_033038 [Prunus dulcis]|uniref:Uncharacterized protein n=1 Tax=Prunus dulcis TaxID=3755 RepID=A0AAD4YWH1_PRUDU|nr:hypothetical protein L3X38_033038 [Prunus dulcis]